MVLTALFIFCNLVVCFFDAVDLFRWKFIFHTLVKIAAILLSVNYIGVSIYTQLYQARDCIMLMCSVKQAPLS